MALIRSVIVGDRTIDLHKFTGEVVDEKKWSTTHVSGGGGGYNVGSGQTNPVSITSTSVTHDQFFLKNESGEERAVEMANAGLALRKGHRVTVLWGIIHGQERGPYIAIYNHTTNNLTMVESSLVELTATPGSCWILGGWIASIFGICFYGIGFVGMIVLFILGRNRKQKNQELLKIFRTAVDAEIAVIKAT